MPGPLGNFFILLGLVTLCNFLYAAGIAEGSSLADALLSFGTLFTLFAWLEHDGRRYRYWPGHHYALWMLFAAPILIPHFVLRTRGRRGFLLAVLLVAALLLPLFAVFLGELVYPNVPEALWIEEP